MKRFLSISYIENYRQTALLAYPLVLSQLGHVMVGVVDTAMVGQIGTLPQAAVALANSLYFLVLVFGLGVAYGVTPLVAAADSAGNHSENGALLKHGLLINTLVGIGLFLLLLILSPSIKSFNQQPQVVEIAIPFLNVMMLGMIPLCVFSSFKQFVEGLSNTRVAMLITIAANLLNILLNYLMIFGHWGFPAMGVMGSCWASFISRLIMAIAMFVYVFYNKRFKVYWQNFNKLPISLKRSKEILSIGVSSGLQWVFEVGAFSCAVVMIGWINPFTQAAHQVALSIASVTYMMASGVSGAASVRVGNQLGINDRNKLRTAGFSAFVMVVALMSLNALILIVFQHQLPLLFNKDEQVVAIAATLLVIAAFFQLSDGIQVVGLGVLRGMKDVKIPTLITLVAYWIIGLPMSYVFAFIFNLGVQGIWCGLLLGLTVAAVLLFARFNYVSKRIAV